MSRHLFGGGFWGNVVTKAQIGLLMLIFGILLIPAMPTVGQDEDAPSSRLLTYKGVTGELAFVEIQDDTTEILSQTTIAPYQSLNSLWVNDETVFVEAENNNRGGSDLYLATTTAIVPLNLDLLLQPYTVNYVAVVKIYDPYVLFEVVGAVDRNIVLLDTTTSTATFLSGDVLAYRFSQSASYYVRLTADGHALRYWTDNGEVPGKFTLVEQDLETGVTQIIHQIEPDEAAVFFVDEAGDEWLFYDPTRDESSLVLYRADGTSQDLTAIDQLEGTFVNIWGNQVLIRTDERTDADHLIRIEGLDTDFEAVLRFPVINAQMVIHHLYEDGQFLVQNIAGGEVWLAQNNTDPIFLGYATQLAATASRDWRWAVVDNQMFKQLWDVEAGRLVHEFEAANFQNLQFFQVGLMFSDRQGSWYIFHFATETVYTLPRNAVTFNMMLADGSVTYSQQGDNGFDTYRYDPITENHTLLFEGLAVYYPHDSR